MAVWPRCRCSPLPRPWRCRCAALGLGGVLYLLFPDWLTTPDARARYPMERLLAPARLAVRPASVNDTLAVCEIRPAIVV